MLSFLIMYSFVITCGFLGAIHDINILSKYEKYYYDTHGKLDL